MLFNKNNPQTQASDKTSVKEDTEVYISSDVDKQSPASQENKNVNGFLNNIKRIIAKKSRLKKEKPRSNLTNTLSNIYSADESKSQLLSEGVESKSKDSLKELLNQPVNVDSPNSESDNFSVNFNSKDTAQENPSADYTTNTTQSDSTFNYNKTHKKQYESKPSNLEEDKNKAIAILSLLLDIEQSARRANSLDELRFIIVNRSFELIKFDRAVLIEETPFGLRAGAVSNIPILNREAPFIIWLQNFIRSLEKKRLLLKTSALKAGDQEETVRNKWLELAPPYAMAIPMTMHTGERPAILVLFNSQPWPESDFVLLNHLCEAYAYIINPLLYRKFLPAIQKRKRSIQLVALVAFIIISIIPVNQKALAPAEISPFDPAYVSAPIDGIVNEVLVEPNTAVDESQLLMKLEDVELQSSYDIAYSSYVIAESNLLKITQEAFNNPTKKSEVSLAQAELEKAQAELNFSANRLDRIHIHSPKKGTIIFRDKSDFIGQPVKVGQRLFLISDPKEVELLIELPVDNAIPLADNAKLRFFVNSDPLHPLDGTLFYHSVRAEVNSTQIAVYRLRARLDNSSDIPRLGSKGTVHIYGDKTLFIFYVLRKPIGHVRQYLGI